MTLKKKYQESSDEELMALIRKGNKQAFEELYDRYSSPLVNFFYRMLWKDREKAEDFMHDLFAKIIQKPESFDGKRIFKTWFYSIANNMCKNEYRKQEVRSRADDYLSKPIAERERNKDIDKQAFKKALNEALENLDPDKRSIFIMRYKQEMSIKEISDILKCSEGTVKSRIFYTIKHLNAALKAYDHLLLLLIYVQILVRVL